MMDFTPSRFEETVEPYIVSSEHIRPTKVAYSDSDRGMYLYQGDCLEIMEEISRKYPDGCFDMIFADPPYRLSNGGMTCYAGKVAKVDKGIWDKSEGPELDFAYTKSWLALCQQVLKWSSRPSHDHLYKILTAIQHEYPDLFPHVQNGIRQAYECLDFDTARLAAQQIEVDGMEGIHGAIAGDVAILVARWMFIEQDITYWTHSGRAKLMGKLREEGLV